MKLFSPPVLLFVFVTHMPFFAWRYYKTREFRHAATALTFALLAVAYAVRVFAPAAEIGGMSWFSVLRIPAWGAASVSLTLLAHHWCGRFARAERAEEGNHP